MQNSTSYHNENRKDRTKSAVIALLVWSAVLLFLFFYKITQYYPQPENTEVLMRINFGDGSAGTGTEEPGPAGGAVVLSGEETAAEPSSEATAPISEKPKSTEPTAEKKTSTEKIITGKGPNKTPVEKSATASAKSSGKNAASSGKKSSGKSSGNTSLKNAIGGLVSGKGKGTGSQGSGGGNGNEGDPLGGSGNGDSKIGIDRKLISYIPGTMGVGGSQPSHKCTARGKISISYVVDAAGNVVSARRSSGTTDPCIVSTTTAWVKRYVKAERASVSSKGVYHIKFQ